MGATRASHSDSPKPGNFQFAGGNELRRQLGLKASYTLLFEEGLQFMRGAGKQDDDSFAAFILAAHPLSGRAAIGVGKNGSAGDDISLLDVVRRHLPTARREPLFEAGDNCGVAVKLQPQRVGHRFPS